MTRAETIERAAQAWTPMGAATYAYDAALIAGLEKAVRILLKSAKQKLACNDPNCQHSCHTEGDQIMVEIAAIHAEITRLKGAK